MVPEAPLDQTECGRVAVGDGWFVLNARDAVWFDRKGRGFGAVLERRGGFDQLGISLDVLGPGEPMAMYHWETDQENFLVLSGTATLIIEGEERPLRQWDFVHCPPGTAHVIVGGPCVVFGVGSRERHTMIAEDGSRTGRPDWGQYVADPAAQKYGAAPEETTMSAEEAYARFPARELRRYSGGLPSFER